VRDIKQRLVSIIAVGLLAVPTAGVAAQDDGMASASPVRFSSTYDWPGGSTPGTSETLDGGIRVVTGEGWLFDSRDATDARFAGPLVMTWNVIHHRGKGNVAFGGSRIETADGAWQQIPAAMLRFEEDLSDWSGGRKPPADNIQFRTFIGERDYAGFTAVVQETWWPGGGDAETVRFDGWIIEGELPPAPEPWSAE